MARAKSGFVLFLLLSVAAFATRAQETDFYVGASLGGATSGACDDIRLGVSCEDRVTNLKLFAGYQINPNLAFEAGYTNTLAKASAHALSSAAPGTTFVSDMHSRAVDFVLVPTLPLGSSASIYAKLGLYAASTTQNSTTTPAPPPPCCVHIIPKPANVEQTNIGLTYGAGVGWSFTPRWTARADWQRFQGVGGENVREIDVDTLNVGLLYRF
jgi:OOP family OmpA-OmpF porin